MAHPGGAGGGLDAAAVIAAWEAGAGEPGAALPGTAPDQPLGARQRALLALRAATFGPALDAVADCPACGAVLDVPLDLDALLAAAGPGDAAPRRVAAGGFAALVRPPSAADLGAAAGAADPARALFEACVLAAARDGDGARVPVAALPDALRAAAAAALAEADPLLEAEVALDCPACGAASVAALDADALVGGELAAEGRRLLGEVAALARAYGWSEAAVLGMGAARRRAYLALSG